MTEPNGFPPYGTVHKDIRFEWTTSDGVRYEAVGFLDENEASIPLDTALRRVANEHIIRTASEAEDLCYKMAGSQDVPAAMYEYRLVTHAPRPWSPRAVACFWTLHDRLWMIDWRFYSRKLDTSDLIVRRVAS